jgi:hypothetical protein
LPREGGADFDIFVSTDGSDWVTAASFPDPFAMNTSGRFVKV